MNFNANSGVRSSLGGGPKKPKRVSDLSAMGAPTSSTAQQFNTFEQNQPPDINNTGYISSSNNQYVANNPYIFNQYPNTTNVPQLQSNVSQNQPVMNQSRPGNSSFPSQFSVFQQPMVQDMAIQYGQKLADQGKEIVHTHFEKYIPVTKLKYYFAVDNKYVLNKLRLIFFPYMQKDWSLKYDHDNPVQPRYDINAPDLYIPTMAYITYVVLAGMVLGFQNRFSPEQLGIQASSALAYSIFELLMYSLSLYIFNIPTTLKTLDLLALTGYKYASIVLILLCSIFLSNSGYYASWLYASASLAFFLLRTLKAKVLSESAQTQSPATYDTYQQQHHHFEHTVGRKRRLYFLLLVTGLQPILTFWLSMHLIPRNSMLDSSNAQ